MKIKYSLLIGNRISPLYHTSAYASITTRKNRLRSAFFDESSPAGSVFTDRFASWRSRYGSTSLFFHGGRIPG